MVRGARNVEVEPSTVRLVADSLALRRAVLGYLGARTASEQDARAMHDATPEAWSLFLRLECCAIPISARLRSDGLLLPFSEPIRSVLTAAETSEMQRVLAARLLIRELDTLASAGGMRLAILKGGVHAADASLQPLDLGDVDVLVPLNRAATAWGVLLAHGWSPTTAGDSPEDDHAAHIHFAPLRCARHAMTLELHHRFAYNRADDSAEPHATCPIPGTRSLDRLVGVQPIVATLEHCVIKHPHRRGHVRDLFLLAEAVRRLDALQLDDLDARLAGEPYGPELRAMLRQVVSLATTSGELTDDAGTLTFVAWKYACAAGPPGLLRSGAPGVASISHIPLERHELRGAEYRRQLRLAVTAVPPNSSVLLHGSVFFRAARALGLPRFIRAVYHLAILILVFLSGARIRWQVRRFAPARSRNAPASAHS